MLAGIFAPAPAFAAESDLQDAITRYWQASESTTIEAAKQSLLQYRLEDLYSALKRGPVYSADVNTGQWEDVRVAGDGTRFPYLVLVPENYDPARSYPVEFMLHGGVSRPEWGPGGEWRRRRQGSDESMPVDRIIVHPASWIDAFWWHANQAENLPAILREVKRRYNVDDNRVTLTGVSDGGTGAYFFAFKQPTEWAAFLPYIGHPGVLRNPASGGGYRLYFENLNKPLYIVNGENDRLYPVSSVRPFIDVLVESGINHVFRPIENGGHNTRWLPDERPAIEQFKLDNPRDPFPDNIRWVAEESGRFNRNHWIRVDELANPGQPGLVSVNRAGNAIDVLSEGVRSFSLLLNPEEVDFENAIMVRVNGELVFDALVEQDRELLLDLAHNSLDRTLLATAQLSIEVP